MVKETAGPRVLVVTNDFPPRVGGVQQYVWNLVQRLPAERVAVLAPKWPGWRDHDAHQPFPVHRWPSTFLWPTADLARRVRCLVSDHRAEVVLIGHGLPLGLLAPGLRRCGVPSVVLTHGAEVWMARVPGTSALLRRALGAASGVTAVSEATARDLRRLMPPGADLTIVYPGVDPDRFSGAPAGPDVVRRHELQGRRVVLCVSRLVRRKGQDTLIRAMPLLSSLVPEAVLLLVGGGPYRAALEGLAADAPEGSVVFAGEVGDDDLPAYYAACDVFAMPCRSRLGGLEVEGFGIVFIEAAAAAKPAVAGRSGGASEAIVDEVTGLLVEGGEPKAVALAVAGLLHDPARAARMGAAGRHRIEEELSWARQAGRVANLLAAAAGYGQGSTTHDAGGAR